MSDMASEVLSALNELQPFCGSETFQWHGLDIPCTANSRSEGLVVTFGGFEVPVEFRLFVAFDDFLSADEIRITADSEVWLADNDDPHPMAGKFGTFRGKQYQIGRAILGPGRGHYEIFLIDPNYTQQE